jgi:hypothetical protein
VSREARERESGVNSRDAKDAVGMSDRRLKVAMTFPFT